MTKAVLEDAPGGVELLLHQAPVGLVECLPDGTIALMNSTAVQLVMPFAEGRPPTSLFSVLGVQGKALQAAVEESAQRAGLVLRGFRIHRDAPEGGCAVLGVTISRTSRGTLLAALEDLTALVLAERRAQAAQRAANAASAAKSEFLAGMSHELRQPLNAILGFSDIMKAGLFGPLPERYDGYVSDIAEAGRHLLALINDVLDLSKVEAGHVELDLEPVPVRDLTAACIRLMHERAEKGGVRLRAVQETELTLRADRRRAKQILINLVSNAIKFTPRGGSVTLAAEPAAPGMVRLTVTDTGCGIAPEDLEAVMRPFQQTAAGRRQTEDSTGLGLPLAAKLAEAHGGHLSLASRVGEGTTAILDLPEAPAAAAEV